jgi:ABC-type multidrug transport system permease subunit
MENNQSYMLSSIFGSYLVHKNPTDFISWSFRAMISSTIFFSMVIYFFGYMQNSILISIFEAIIISALVTSITGLILIHVTSKYKDIQSI